MSYLTRRDKTLFGAMGMLVVCGLGVMGASTVGVARANTYWAAAPRAVLGDAPAVDPIVAPVTRAVKAALTPVPSSPRAALASTGGPSASASRTGRPPKPTPFPRTTGATMPQGGVAVPGSPTSDNTPPAPTSWPTGGITDPSANSPSANSPSANAPSSADPAAVDADENRPDQVTSEPTAADPSTPQQPDVHGEPPASPPTHPASTHKSSPSTVATHQPSPLVAATHKPSPLSVATHRPSPVVATHKPSPVATTTEPAADPATDDPAATLPSLPAPDAS